MRADLDRMIETLKAELAARMEDDIVPVPGLGVLYRGYTRRSEWRDENASADFRKDVGEAIVSKIALDLSTGELDPAKRNLARAEMKVMRDVRVNRREIVLEP